MFENYTFDFLMERMLNKLPEDVDKRQGSVIYDLLSPAAYEMAELYQSLDMVMEEGYADTASYYYLLKRGAERGIKPKEATNAEWKMEVKPTTLELATGERFNYQDMNFVVIGKLGSGLYKIQCETEGRDGNNASGSVVPVEYIEDFESAKLVELLVAGEEEESEEEYRLKYFASVNAQTFGGNIADYKKWLKEMAGVGDAKIYPVWNGGGTVKVVIINSEYQKPSDALITSIQTALDPEVNRGEGVGLAPIGHVVTVLGVNTVAIHVATNLTYQSGYSFSGIKESLETALDNYLQILSNTWAKEENLIVRISQIENHFLQVDGVLDISGTQINGVEENLMIDKDSIPIRGDVSERSR